MKDIKNTTPKDIVKAIAEKRAEIRAFRFGTAGSANKDVKAARNARKDIARMMTELRARAK